MPTSQEHLKLLMYRNAIDFESAYCSGYEAAQQSIDLEENIFDENSDEFSAWEQGWWHGFYNEPPHYKTDKKSKTTC